MKTIKYADFRRKQLQEAEVRGAFEELADEFMLSREVLELRKAKNLTQKQLAEEMGTSQPAIARIESGNYRNVSFSFIRRLAAALDAVPELHLRKKEPQSQ